MAKALKIKEKIMIYAIVKDGQPIKLASLRNKVDGKVGFHKMTDEQRKAFGWYPTNIIYDDYNPMVHRQVVNMVLDEDLEVVNVHYRSYGLSQSQIRENKLQAGFAFEFDSKEYQVNCSGSALSTLTIHKHRVIDGTINVKLDGQFIELSESQYNDLLAQIAEYVQQCFDEELAG